MDKLLAKSSLSKDDSTSDSKNSKRFKNHHMLAPFTPGRETNPVVIDKSEGCYIYDIDGNKYLDALAGLWCTSLGGSESRLVEAATAQLKKLPFYHSFVNRTTEPSLVLAKDLIEMFTPRKMGKAFFVNSGSEANDTMVKFAWYYYNALGQPNKKKFIARDRSYACHLNLWYHGTTVASSSLSGYDALKNIFSKLVLIRTVLCYLHLPTMHKKFNLPLPFVLHTNCPHYWRYHLPGETEEEYSTRLANNLLELILKEGPDTIAAFIAEPLIGAGGVIPPPATYFEKIQAVLKKYDILFIVDEVICGFGRLGTMFGCDKYNIKPDLVSLAKGLSSAYLPIGAVLVSPEVSEVIDSQSTEIGGFFHGFTYSGHPVASALAIEALKIYKEINIVDKVNKISPKFQDGLKAFSDSPIVGEVRGTGLVIGIEFTKNKSPNDFFPRVGAYFSAQCEKNGLIVRAAGELIMMCPPLIISPQEVDELIRIFGKALKATEERVQELESQLQ
ncbi:hypothetical protein Lal_00029001 [Lupinus albus]|nr:hypothetical protein Lal_00029001 [Lupinus albus]